MKQLTNQIKQHRGRLDLTQKELAKQVGVSRTTLGAIERGSTPCFITALRIADVFGISVHDFFELEIL